MSKLRCLLLLSILVFPAFSQRLNVRLGNPAARNVVVSTETPGEGSFILQRSDPGFTNWVALTNFNSFAATNTFSDTRTNKQRFYRLVQLTEPAAITSQPVGTTNYVTREVRLEAATTGSWPIRYQWLKDGQPVAGATSNKLVFNAQAASSGTYKLFVSNSWGIDLSADAVVKVTNPVATNLAGKRIRFVIRSAQGGAIGSGTFETTFNSLGFYNATSSNALLNDSGYWQYAYSASQPLGRITLSGSFIYPDGTVNDLTFTNEAAGTYLIQLPNHPARQSGDFTFIQ